MITIKNIGGKAVIDIGGNRFVKSKNMICCYQIGKKNNLPSKNEWEIVKNFFKENDCEREMRKM